MKKKKVKNLTYSLSYDNFVPLSSRIFQNRAGELDFTRYFTAVL